jgi:hypothetical protein
MNTAGIVAAHLQCCFLDTPNPIHHGCGSLYNAATTTV